jgi:PAS domain S-box-containing protein
MEYKYFDYIPLPALVINQQSGDILYTNSKFKTEVGDISNTKNITDLFVSPIDKIPGNYESIKCKSPFQYDTGNISIQATDEKDQLLLTFNQFCAQKNNRYQEIFNQASDGMVVVNNKLKVIEINDAFCKLVDIEKNELLHKSAIKLAYKYANLETISSLVNQLKKVIKGETITNFTLYYQNKIFSINLTKSTGSPFFIGILRDITERINTTDQLEKSESKYKTLINSSLDGIAILVDGIISFVNPTMTKLFEYSQEELIGTHFINLVADQEKERAAEIYKNLNILNQNTLRYTSLAQTKSKRILDVEVIVVPMEYEGKQAIQIILRDITESVKAQKELKNSEEKFRFLSKSTFEGIIVHNKGRIIDINDSFAELSGYSKEESIGENILDYIPSIKDRTKAILKMAQSNASPYVISINTKQGAHLKVEIQARNVYHQGKKVRIAAVRDVTERELIQSRLEESEKRYRAVFENTGAASCILEKDGIISLANSKFAELSGYSIEEIVNHKTWMEFVDEKDLIRMKEQHQLRRQSHDKALQKYEFTFINKQQEKKEILLVIDVIEGTDKSVASLLDITYLKHTEKSLIRANKALKSAKEKAEESDQLKSAFLANMSHEIRTPMNGILGFTSLLEEPDISAEEQKQYVEVIKRGGQRMLDTVNDLIDISKIETGQVEIHISEFNIHKEIKSLYQFFKPEANKKGIEISWIENNITKDLVLNTDQHKFNSILTNLIKNAIKYTDSGQILIDSKIENKQLHIHVSDTGIGIPKHRLTAIFNRFEQVDFTDTRAFDGSGLGLAISKAYVEMLGGNISCESEVGKGSSFYFYIDI